MVTTRPMNHGTALSDSATNNSMTNKAANSHFAWRAKCHRNATSPPGGSGFSGAAVGVRNRSKSANICGWLQGLCGQRQSTCQALPILQPGENWDEDHARRIVTTAFSHFYGCPCPCHLYQGHRYCEEPTGPARSGRPDDKLR